ncbi:hypothetical protein ABFT23_00240 [Nocardioides sp. C4-1]|uniref:hypothetical protein n=1 Tax=Nocardioides sp. C4-1 TaxID=3151851 RepID=UPI003267B145
MPSSGPAERHEPRSLDDAQRTRRDGALRRLVGDQAGIVARRQLTAIGIDWDAVDAHVAARRWVVRTPRVVSTVTGVLTTEQRRWVGVLHAGPRSILGGLTAASRHGLASWERDDVTVLVDDELSFEHVPGVRFFRSRRPFRLLTSTKPGIPSALLEPAILLWAAYSAPPRVGVGVLAAAVQQRLTTAERLTEWIDQLHPLRRAKVFRSALGDIALGAHSAAELDVARMCLLARMPRPVRQRPRVDRSGKRRWTDCEWVTSEGRVVVLEVAGPAHQEAATWDDDLRRLRRITAHDRVVVQCSSRELRHEPRQVAVDLIALGVPGQLPDSAA